MMNHVSGSELQVGICPGGNLVHVGRTAEQRTHVTEMNSDCGIISHDMMTGAPYFLTGKRKSQAEIDDDAIYGKFGRQGGHNIDLSLSLTCDATHDSIQAQVQVPMSTNMDRTLIPLSGVRYPQVDDLPVDETTFDQPMGLIAQGQQGLDNTVAGKAKKTRTLQPRQQRAPKPDSIPWEEW